MIWGCCWSHLGLAFLLALFVVSDSASSYSVSRDQNSLQILFPNNDNINHRATEVLPRDDDGNDVCTEQIPAPNDDPNTVIHFYPPLSLACPAVGERVMATFTHRLHIEPDTNNHSSAQVSVAVSHTGGVVGITMGNTFFRTCGSIVRQKEDLENPLFFGEPNNFRCLDRLDSPDLLCAAATKGTTAGREISTAIIVWNDGGCQGNVTFEAAIRDSPRGLVTTAGACTKPLERACQDEIDAEVPLVPPPIPSNSICTQEEDEDLISTATANNFVLQYFPPVSVPCPEIGDYATFRFSYQFPRAISIGDEPYTSVYLSFALSHDDVDSPTSGMTLGSPFWPNSCDALDAAIDLYGFDSVDAASSDPSECDGRLGSSDKLCLSTSISASPGFVATKILTAWNDGGCVGNVTVEASVREYSSVVQFSTGVSCISPLTHICAAVPAPSFPSSVISIAPSGSVPWSPTALPSKSPSSLSPNGSIPSFPTRGPSKSPSSFAPNENIPSLPTIYPSKAPSSSAPNGNFPSSPATGMSSLAPNGIVTPVPTTGPSKGPNSSAPNGSFPSSPTTGPKTLAPNGTVLSSPTTGPSTGPISLMPNVSFPSSPTTGPSKGPSSTAPNGSFPSLPTTGPSKGPSSVAPNGILIDSTNEPSSKLPNATTTEALSANPSLSPSGVPSNSPSKLANETHILVPSEMPSVSPSKALIPAPTGWPDETLSTAPNELPIPTQSGAPSTTLGNATNGASITTVTSSSSSVGFTWRDLSSFPLLVLCALM